jgi:ParB-like chromosome segregation protein Spo0J
MDAKVRQPAWPADKIERRAIAKLKPYERNTKRHPAVQIKQIAAAMREWGWTMPVLIDEHGKVLAGHARIEAAKQNGYSEAPVLVARGWSDAQKRAYLIADNKLTEGGRWDEALLADELSGLHDVGFEVGLVGLSEGDLKRLAGGNDDAVQVQEIATGPVNDEFWISIRGPLAHQADVLAKMRKVLADYEGVSVELGVIVV